MVLRVHGLKMMTMKRRSLPVLKEEEAAGAGDAVALVRDVLGSHRHVPDSLLEPFALELRRKCAHAICRQTSNIRHTFLLENKAQGIGPKTLTYY